MARRFRPLLARRHLKLLPLQTHWTITRICAPDHEPMPSSAVPSHRPTIPPLPTCRAEAWRRRAGEGEIIDSRASEALTTRVHGEPRPSNLDAHRDHEPDKIRRGRSSSALEGHRKVAGGKRVFERHPRVTQPEFQPLIAKPRDSANLMCGQFHKPSPIHREGGWSESQSLPLPPEQLLKEMRFLRPDGQYFGGADALLEIARYFWWAWPLGQIGRVAPIKHLLRAAYRWIARHRNCADGHCNINAWAALKGGGL